MAADSLQQKPTRSRWHGGKSWGVMGRRYLLRVPELVPEDKSLDCFTSGPVHWRGLWDGKEP